MVTHDARIAANAGRILFMKDGVIAEEMRLDARDATNAERVMDKVRLLV
jgi:ABC-type lipoprotein export system ATPase subunit